MIEYKSRYSSNEEYDKMGRWARIAFFRDIQIAWINRNTVGKVTSYSVSCHFPTLGNDTATEHKSFDSLDGAKSFIEERWRWFRDEVSYHPR